MKIAQITEESIKILIDNFYQKVRQNPELKPLFENKIGTSYEAWKPHLQTMYDFWSSIMLSSGKYKGNPLKKHKDLEPFDENNFAIWLKLFKETAQEIFEDDIAQKFVEKSEMIAKSLRYGLYFA